MNDLDVRKQLVESILEGSKELRLYNLLYVEYVNFKP